MCEAALSDGVGLEFDGVHHRLVDTIAGGFAAARRVRRFWSEDEKRRIVAQTCAQGVSVSQVGRRYDVNANLIAQGRSDRALTLDVFLLLIEVGEEGVTAGEMAERLTVVPSSLMHHLSCCWPCGC